MGEVARPKGLILFPKDSPPETMSEVTRQVYAAVNGQGVVLTSADAFVRYKEGGGGWGGWGSWAGMGRDVSGQPNFDYFVVVENPDGYVGKGNYDVVLSALENNRQIAVWRNGVGAVVVGLRLAEHDTSEPDYNKKLAWQNYAKVRIAGEPVGENEFERAFL